MDPPKQTILTKVIVFYYIYKNLSEKKVLSLPCKALSKLLSDKPHPSFFRPVRNNQQSELISALKMSPGRNNKDPNPLLQLSRGMSASTQGT